MLLFLIASAFADFSVPIKRDHSMIVPQRYAVEVRIGTPALVYRLALTSGATAGISLFKCVQDLSESYANDTDIVRFSKQAMLMTHRKKLRSRLGTECDELQKRSEPMVAAAEAGLDGVFDLHHVGSPLWRSFSGFTLNRNTLHLHETLGSFDGGIECLEGADNTNYCEFDAFVGKHRVRVALSIDQVGITVPQWFDVNASTLEFTPVGAAHAISVDLDDIREKQQLALHAQDPWIPMDEEDDDDDSGQYRVANAQQLLQFRRAKAAKRAALSDPYVKHGSRLVIGSSLLLQFQVEKQMTAPHASVRIVRLVIREHWQWYESILFAIAFTHIISLVCHSALYHAMYMAGILAGQRRVLWIELFSIAVILFCAACTIALIAANWAVLEGDVLVFLLLQVAANLAVFLFLSPRVIFRFGLYHYLHLSFMAAGEQLVVMTLLTLSLVVRTDTDTRAPVSVLVVFVAVANAARNLYKSTFLIIDRRNAASRSVTFTFLYGGLLGGVNLVYTAVQMASSVLVLAFDGTLVGATGGTFIVIVAAVLVGTYITDAYRNAEIIEARTGQVPDAPTSVGFY
jgi:hypothetical protein